MKKAFTLAEVLITLGVIGVVAALTLPNVLMNFRERTYIASLQRAYNAIANATTTLMAAEDVDSLAQSSLVNSDGRNQFMNKYFKVAKDCGGSMSGCFSNSYESTERSYTNYGSHPSNYSYQGGSYDYKCVVLDTGCGVCMSTVDRGTGAMNVTIDTNGPKTPNINGRDFFQFFVTKEGRVGSSPTAESYVAGSYCRGFSYGCLSQIIADGWQMKY